MDLSLVKTLRDKTGVAMMDCKKALIETGGDLEKAIDLLRKKGIAIANKRAGNDTKNGTINAYISDDKHNGCLIKVACETDFSANTDIMKTFALGSAKTAAEQTGAVASVEDLLKLPMSTSSLSIQDELDQLISKIAESIKIDTFTCYQSSDNGLVNSYIHPDNSVGVLTHLENASELSESQMESALQLARDISMHAAVTNPAAVRPEELDPSIIKRETEVIQEQLRNANKPEAMIEKITAGKIKKYYEDVCLLNQKFIKDDKVTVQQHIDNINKELGTTLKVENATRISTR